MPVRRQPRPERPFIQSVELMRDQIDNADLYPYTIPGIAAIGEIPLGDVTIFVGENGSGKSTLVEAIAVAAGFNAEGGSQNFAFSTFDTHSSLSDALRLIRGPARPRTGFFLRAETYYNVASEIDRLNDGDLADQYGGLPHERSHGESFVALVNHRFGANGLYILDEPEAALSPTGCLALLRRIRELVSEGAQFIYATHSPLLMAYPGAHLYEVTARGPHRVAFDDLAHVALMRNFLAAPDTFMRALLSG